MIGGHFVQTLKWNGVFRKMKINLMDFLYFILTSNLNNSLCSPLPVSGLQFHGSVAKAFMLFVWTFFNVKWGHILFIISRFCLVLILLLSFHLATLWKNRKQKQKLMFVLHRCIVKITGDVTLSFPMGIIKVFTTNLSPAVLAFKLKNTSRLEQILPNQQLLYRCALAYLKQLIESWSREPEGVSHTGTNPERVLCTDERKFN